jgi:DNA-binding beta-propeller fold protein YncE
MKILRVMAAVVLCVSGIAMAQVVESPVTPSAGALLVVTKQSHALAIVDAATLTVVGHVPIGEDPHEVVVGPDGVTAYVSNFGEMSLHTLQVIDLVDQKALTPIDISPLRGAHGLAVHGGRIWFTAGGSKALGVLDPATGKIESVLGVGQENTHMVWVSRDGAKIVASNAGSGTMSIFDRVVHTPVMVAGAPAAPATYTAQDWKQTLLPDGMGAEGFAVSPDEKEVWAGAADGTITIINLVTEKVDATLTPDVFGANRLTFTPDGKLVLVTAHTGKNLVVLDAKTREVVKRIPIEERGASGIQVQPDGARVFVSCPRDHYVAVVDLKTLTMVAKVDAGREPDGLTWWSGPRK